MGSFKRLIERLEEAATLDIPPSKEPMPDASSKEPIIIQSRWMKFHVWPYHFAVLEDNGTGFWAQSVTERTPTSGAKFYKLIHDEKIREELKALESEKEIRIWLRGRKIAHM